ncbi:MAG: hypothetical protein ACI4V3_02610 [Faecousia sp.]
MTWWENWYAVGGSCTGAPGSSRPTAKVHSIVVGHDDSACRPDDKKNGLVRTRWFLHEIATSLRSSQ